MKCHPGIEIILFLPNCILIMGNPEGASLAYSKYDVSNWVKRAPPISMEMYRCSVTSWSNKNLPNFPPKLQKSFQSNFNLRMLVFKIAQKSRNIWATLVLCHPPRTVKFAQSAHTGCIEPWLQLWWPLGLEIK